MLTNRENQVKEPLKRFHPLNGQTYKTIVEFTKNRGIGSPGIQFRSEEITQMFGEVLSDENT